MALSVGRRRSQYLGMKAATCKKADIYRPAPATDLSLARQMPPQESPWQDKQWTARLT